MSRGCVILLVALASLTSLVLTVLALASIAVNEAQVDLAALARESRALRPDDPAAPPGALVSRTGSIGVGALFGDDLLLAPGPYLRVERIVEMYAWQRYRDGEDSNGRPRYSEQRIWTGSPDSGLLSNPRLPFTRLIRIASHASIGSVQINLAAAELPLSDRLALQPEHLLPGAESVVKDGYLYISSGPTSRPHVGDLRVSYHVVPDLQLVTVFGSLDGDHMVPYRAVDSHSLHPEASLPAQHPQPAATPPP